MKLTKIILILLISFSVPFKAISTNVFKNILNDGGKLIFIRHAYAPGGGDPDIFDINDCSTQRNLSEEGRKQAKNIGNYFKKNLIPIDIILSSEWCRCKETAQIAFEKYETKNFLNSFFSEKFSKNKTTQIKELKKYIKKWDGNKNLVFITHYVVISEVLNYTPSSGEIVISNIRLKKLGNIEVEY